MENTLEGGGGEEPHTSQPATSELRGQEQGALPSLQVSKLVK